MNGSTELYNTTPQTMQIIHYRIILPRHDERLCELFDLKQLVHFMYIVMSVKFNAYSLLSDNRISWTWSFIALKNFIVKIWSIFGSIIKPNNFTIVTCPPVQV